MKSQKSETYYPLVDDFNRLWGRTFITIAVSTVVSLLSILIIRALIGEAATEISLVKIRPFMHIIFPLLFLGGGFAVKFLLIPKVTENRQASLFGLYGAGGFFSIMTTLTAIQYVTLLSLVVAIVPVFLGADYSNMGDEAGKLYLFMGMVIVNLIVGGIALTHMVILSRMILEQCSRSVDNALYFYQQNWLKAAVNFVYIPIGLAVVYLVKSTVSGSRYGMRSSPIFGGDSFDTLLSAINGGTAVAILFALLLFLVGAVVVPYMNRKKSWALYTASAMSIVVLIFTVVVTILSLKDLYIPFFKSIPAFKDDLIPQRSAPFSALWIVLVYGGYFTLYNIFFVRAIIYLYTVCFGSWGVISDTKFGSDLSDIESPVINAFTDAVVEGMGEDDRPTFDDQEPVTFSVNPVQKETLSAKERLAQLQELLSDGLISQEEFDQKREGILSEL